MLKRITILLTLTAVWSVCYAQTTVNRYRYWLDNATPTTVEHNTGSAVALQPDISAQQTGMHFIYFQAHNTAGKWGKVHKYMYYIAPPTGDAAASDLGTCEYWIDDNFAERTTRQAQNMEMISIDVSQLSTGVHYFNYRAQNKQGEWGELTRKLFLFAPLKGSSPVSHYEVWIDNDYDGTQQGGEITGSAVALDYDVSQLSTGCHFLFFRARNARGEWGKLHRYLFYIAHPSSTAEVADLGTCEYWLDDDYAGRTIGKANTFETLSLDISHLSTGVHFFNYRAQNVQGEWGELTRKLFMYAPVEQAAPVDFYEAWIDDNYEGTKKSGSVTGEAVSLDFDLSAMREGCHFLYFRARNTEGGWGKLQKYLFYIAPTTSTTTSSPLGNCEYWLDDEFAGRTTAKANALENLSINISHLKQGLHYFNYRAQNTQGEWGEVTRKFFYVVDKYAVKGDPITAYRYTMNEQTVTKKITATTTYENTVVVPMPKNLLGWAAVDDSCRFAFDDVQNKVTMKRNVECLFAMQFQNKGGNWSAPIDTTFVVADSVIYTIDPLNMNGSVSYNKLQKGDYRAFKMQFDKDGIYYLRSTQDCRLMLFDAASGACIANLESYELKTTYGAELTAGTYYGIIYNTVTDEDNTDSKLTVRLMLTADAEVPEPVIAYDKGTVSISCELSEAKIYYTIDGSDPLTSATRQQYTQPFVVDGNAVIKAVAEYEGYNPSAVVTYTVDGLIVRRPMIQYADGQVSITCETPNSTIWYTTDGTDPNTSATRRQYSAPFTMTGNGVIKAVAERTGYEPSPMVELVINSYVVENPTISLDGYDVTIECATTGATIWYTTDDTDPQISSTRKTYVAPFTIPGNTVIKYYATLAGYTQSEVMTYSIEHFKVALPVIEDTDGEIAIRCETPNATIWYTTDGSDPANSSTRKVYIAPFNVEGDMMIKAVGMLDYHRNSDVAQYLRSGYTVAAPVITFNRTDYLVTIKSETSQAEIWYTLDDSDPTTSTTRKKYEAPFELKHNAVVKAVGQCKGYVTSAVSTYVIDNLRVEAPTVSYEGNVLTIQCGTAGATIYYEIGNAVNPATSAVYTEPITLKDNRTVYVVATLEGFETSEVTMFTPTNFTCEPVSIRYDGRTITMETPTTGASIRYTTDGTEPSEESTEYRDPVTLDGLCTVKAMVTKGYTNKSSTVIYEVPAYYNEGKTYVAKAGQLTKAYEWCDMQAVSDMHIVGTINAADLATIKSIASLQHLNLSEAAVESEQLPDEAFAGMKLISLSTPLKLQKVGAQLLNGVATIGAVEWNANIPVPEDIFGGVQHPNLLLYVKQRSYADDKLCRNIVVNDYADKIVLSDEKEYSNFYCPRAFTAGSIRYSHIYSMETKIGECQGWEAISLPFDVQNIQHVRQGAIAPFLENNEEKKPFWLYHLSGHFTSASGLEANTPYIICMPNSEDYAEDYILGGEVSFSSENVIVPRSGEMVIGEQGYFQFKPNYQHIAANDTLMTLNIHEAYENYLPGSVFVANHRDAKPFEAYITSDRKLSKGMIFDIDGSVSAIEDLTALRAQDVYSEHGILYINVRSNCSLNLYSADGRLVRVLQLHGGLNEIRGLVEGVYVVKGMKIIIK